MVLQTSVAMILSTLIQDAGIDMVHVRQVYCPSITINECIIPSQNGKLVAYSHQRFVERMNRFQPVEIIYTERNPQVGQTRIFYINRAELQQKMDEYHGTNLTEPNYRY